MSGEEVVLCTSKKETTGMLVLDVASGTNACPSFKHCVAEPGCLIAVGKSESSYEGMGSAGDYIVTSVPTKPLVHIYQWTKPQVLLQCHTQEIIDTLGTDFLGNLIYGGTKRGHIYVWEVATGELLKTWHAHFKGVTAIISDPTGQFCISSSEDGMVRVWDLASILDSSSTQVSKKNIQPFRSWTSHALPIKSMLVLGSMRAPRIVSCSLDKTVTFNDIYTGKQTLRVSFGNSLECMACDATEDIIAFGSSTGEVYLLNISAASQSIAFNLTQSLAGSSISKSVNSLIGHTKAVKSLAFSKISIGTLLTASEDGSLRWWNVFTRQCVKEMKPFSGVALTNILITSRPAIIGSSVHKQSISPLMPLKKYPEDPAEGKSAKVVLGPRLMGRMLKTTPTVGSSSSSNSNSGSGGNNNNISSLNNSNSGGRTDEDLLVLDSQLDETVLTKASVAATLRPTPKLEGSFIKLSDKPLLDDSGSILLFEEVKKKDRKRYAESSSSNNNNDNSGHNDSSNSSNNKIASDKSKKSKK